MPISSGSARPPPPPASRRDEPAPAFPVIVERLTKSIVVIWSCAGIVAVAWLLTRGWPDSLWVTLLAFGGAAAAVAVDRRAAALVLVFTYVFPVVIHLSTGLWSAQLGIVWMAALLGAMVPDALRSGWHVPAPWRGVLAGWALVIAAGATIVALREVDFTTGVLFESSARNTSAGALPYDIISWVLHVALVLLVGLLWFDWLLGARAILLRIVVPPLGVSAAVMALVACYQQLTDPAFLNPTVFGGMGRAAGTLLDANVSGMLGAMWIGGAYVWSRPLGAGRNMAAVVGGLLGWLTVWGSSSRTAFAVAALVTASVGFAAMLRRQREGVRISPWRVVGLLAGAVVVGLAMLSFLPLEVVGPIRRLWDTLPGVSVESWRAFAYALWSRDQLGSAGVDMIRDYPLTGVGPGMFHFLAFDYLKVIGMDNAQSWYRHQLAEFGIVGSLPWIVWIGMAAHAVFAWRQGPPEAWVWRSVLVAFALVSLVAVPSQDVSVTITFWTMFAAYLTETGFEHHIPSASQNRRWATAAVVLALYVWLVGSAATTVLRPAHRAQRGGWAYSYGLYPAENDDEFRWTRQRAVAVIEPEGTVLELTAAVDPFVLAGPARGDRRPTGIRPVELRISCNGDVAARLRLDTSRPVTTPVRIDPNQWVLIETWVDQLVDPQDVGIVDDRELGARVRWQFSGDAVPSVP